MRAIFASRTPLSQGKVVVEEDDVPRMVGV